MTNDRIKGAFFALTLGDAMGAACEDGVSEKTAEGAIERIEGSLRWTDDTQMSIDIMESLIASGEVNQNDIARRFAHSYESSRGYGQGASEILKKIRNGMHWHEASRSVYRDGSYGNGAAMRVGPIGLFFANHGANAVVHAARKTAVITHAHPLGIEGASLVALATAGACRDDETATIMGILKVSAGQSIFQGKLRVAQRWLENDTVAHVTDVRSQLGNGVAAQDSVVTAVYCALSHRHLSFEELLQFIRTLGGDMDTIGAMAGAIWGAARGVAALPEKQLLQLERQPYLEDLSCRFQHCIVERPTVREGGCNVAK